MAPGSDVVDEFAVGAVVGLVVRVDRDVVVVRADEVGAVVPTRDVVVVAGASVVDGTDRSVVGARFVIGAVGSGGGAGRTST